jgi:hypothetical protein
MNTWRFISAKSQKDQDLVTKNRGNIYHVHELVYVLEEDISVEERNRCI